MMTDSTAPVRRRSRARPAFKHERLRRMQRLVVQGELAATAVHEISNLQTIVLFNAGLLRERRKNDPEVRQYVDPLLHAATMIATLCSQLRNLAHPVEPQAQLMDLGEISRGAYRLLQQIIGRRLTFEREQEGPILVVAEPGPVEQMLINLILNSRDATQADTGRITVRVGRMAGSGRPWLEVEDNGTGMSPRVRAKVFTKYFTTKAPGHGTGLGLVTVRRLLESMGGKITLRSRVGQGTRVRLTFPAPSPALIAVHEPAPDLANVPE